MSLGDVRLGDVMLGDVRLGDVTLCVIGISIIDELFGDVKLICLWDNCAPVYEFEGLIGKDSSMLLLYFIYLLLCF